MIQNSGEHSSLGEIQAEILQKQPSPEGRQHDPATSELFLSSFKEGHRSIC